VDTDNNPYTEKYCTHHTVGLKNERLASSC